MLTSKCALPSFGVPDIVDAHVEVRAPEERHLIEPFARAQNIPRRGLALPLRDDPVLHANRLARMPIGPARDVTGRVDAGCTRLEVLVYHDAAIHAKAGPFGELQPRPD